MYSLFGNDYEFVNYSLNGNLRRNNTPDQINAKKFYDKFITMGDMFEKVLMSKDKMCYINDSYLEKMNILNNLYNIYENIYNLINIDLGEENKSCLQYAEECVREYTICLNKCPKDDTSFCKALEGFRELYESLIKKSSQAIICAHMDLPNLPIYKNTNGIPNIKTDKEENDRIDSIIIIGPMLGMIPILDLFYSVRYISFINVNNG
ncbi:PIR Superfamily Protein [Plasmodium ovale wallikeri]|uniref:PIR Superfamily Protein n=1 Tax=Plasmodium ovale wallikeri TaxID=864142 RepID=A0A1A9ADD5_PLAOA|nr:PIR Superfamily Protein [Plasmodium ovale wallikeri]SBT56163.1 PIR Superfamily Protein [Plasmodium ovale wallikeri]